MYRLCLQGQFLLRARSSHNVKASNLVSIADNVPASCHPHQHYYVTMSGLPHGDCNSTWKARRVVDRGAQPVFRTESPVPVHQAHVKKSRPIRSTSPRALLMVPCCTPCASVVKSTQSSSSTGFSFRMRRADGSGR
jgi:hypothetical protein